MVVDSSALLAVLLKEPGYEAILKRLIEAPLVAVAAPTLVETAMVLASRVSGDPRYLLNELVREAGIEVIEFAERHFEIAVDAFLAYGKGRHKAALNYGDCLSYAAARAAGMPLLYRRNDFSKTDLA